MGWKNRLVLARGGGGSTGTPLLERLVHAPGWATHERAQPAALEEDHRLHGQSSTAGSEIGADDSEGMHSASDNRPAGRHPAGCLAG